MLTFDIVWKVTAALLLIFGTWWVTRKINNAVDFYFNDVDKDNCYCNCDHCKQCSEWEKEE